jgi:hypothetical protein
MGETTKQSPMPRLPRLRAIISVRRAGTSFGLAMTALGRWKWKLVHAPLNHFISYHQLRATPYQSENRQGILFYHYKRCRQGSSLFPGSFQLKLRPSLP